MTRVAFVGLAIGGLLCANGAHAQRFHRILLSKNVAVSAAIAPKESATDKLPTELDFLKFCKAAANANAKGPSAKLPEPEALGWHPSLIDAPLTRSSSVGCALGTADYWNMLGAQHGELSDVGAHRIADQLVWRVADVVSKGAELTAAEQTKALALFQTAAQNAKDKRSKSILYLAGRSIGAPGTGARSLADLASDLQDIVGTSLVEVVRRPSFLRVWSGPHTYTSPDLPPAEPAYYRETSDLWALVEEALAAQFAGTAGDLFKGTEFASGDNALQLAHLVDAIAGLPPDVERRFVIDRMKIDQPVKLQTLVGSAVPNAPMTYNATGSVYVGRCGTQPLVNSALTTASNWQLGFGCGYSPGTNGEALISYNKVFSNADTDGEEYYIEIYSSAHGGYWNHGGENETATVSYKADGQATLGQCNDVSTCGPFVTLTYQNESQIDAARGIDPTTTLSIGYKRASDSTFTMIPAGTLATVDRSDGPIELQLIVGRSYSHVGACCQAPYVIQTIVMRARAASEPPNWFDPDDWTGGAIRFINDPVSRTDPVDKTTWSGIGYLLSGTDALPENVEFRDRFREHYLRLLFATKLETTSTAALDAANIKTASLARLSLSELARKQFLQTAEESYRATHQVYTSLPFARVINSLNAAIIELSHGQLPSGPDPLADIEKAANDLGPHIPSDITTATKSARDALAAKRQLDALKELISVRAALWGLEAGWRSELADLVTEISLFDPALGADPTKI